MFKRIMGAACCALIFCLPGQRALAQGIPVIDPAAIAKYVEQIAILKQQLESTKRQFESLTGTRNLGDLLSNPAIRAALPDDVSLVLKDLQSVSSALASSVNSIMSETNAPVADFSVDRMALQTRFQQLNATAKALTEQSYKMINARLGEIDGLQGQIDLATDPKAIADLQARLTVAQSNLAGDKMRADLAQRQIEAEKDLLKDRAQVIYNGWFDPSLTKGPLQ